MDKDIALGELISGIVQEVLSKQEVLDKKMIQEALTPFEQSVIRLTEIMLKMGASLKELTKRVEELEKEKGYND